jgi:hypothetical protein
VDNAIHTKLEESTMDTQLGSHFIQSLCIHPEGLIWLENIHSSYLGLPQIRFWKKKTYANTRIIRIRMQIRVFRLSV